MISASLTLFFSLSPPRARWHPPGDDYPPPHPIGAEQRISPHNHNPAATLVSWLSLFLASLLYSRWESWLLFFPLPFWLSLQPFWGLGRGRGGSGERLCVQTHGLVMVGQFHHHTNFYWSLSKAIFMTPCSALKRLCFFFLLFSLFALFLSLPLSWLGEAVGFGCIFTLYGSQREDGIVKQSVGKRCREKRE